MFGELPRDIRYYILLKLPLKDLSHVFRVNKYTQTISCDPIFWRRKLLMDYPDVALQRFRFISERLWYVHLVQTESLKHAINREQIVKLYNWYNTLEEEVCIELDHNFRTQQFYDVWPNQTSKDKVISHLFFPV